MNVIERTRYILEQFPQIAEVCNVVHVDFADPEPTSYGLSSVDDTLIYEDTGSGRIERITAENGMLYAVPQDNIEDAVQYQMRIIVRYTTGSEESEGNT